MLKEVIFLVSPVLAALCVDKVVDQFSHTTGKADWAVAFSL